MIYAPQPVPYQPPMQGYAPPPPPQMAYPQYAQAPMRRPGNGWWKWALAAGLGGLGLGGVMLGNRMEQNDLEEIKRNKRNRWMPNFDMDPVTMTTLLGEATRFLPKAFKLKETISDAINSKSAISQEKKIQKLNTDFATAFKNARDGRDIIALKDAINTIKQSGNDNLVDKKLWNMANKASQQGHFSESTSYYDRYKDINFNYPPYAMPPQYSQPYPQPYPQPPMMQGYAPQAQYYAPQPSRGKNLGRLALGLSALAALGGGAYALRKATAHNEEIAESQKPSFINQINIPDLLSPLMSSTNIIQHGMELRNRKRGDKLSAIRKDTRKDIDSILAGKGKIKDADRGENNVGSAYKASDVAGQIADTLGIAFPFVKKLMQYRADQEG